MKSYYSEQLKLNEDALEYMQVYDRTTNSLVDRNLWEYRDGIVTINAIKYHEYTVNFFRISNVGYNTYVQLHY